MKRLLKHWMISCAAAALLSFFPPGRIPSEADASLSHQDPQNDGQKPFKPRHLPAAAAAHQELPAAPKLTLCSFCREAHSPELVQPPLQQNNLWAPCGNYYFITINQFYFECELYLSTLLTAIIIY